MPTSRPVQPAAMEKQAVARETALKDMRTSVPGSILILVLLVATILVLMVGLDNLYMDAAGALMLTGCAWLAVGMLRGWRREKQEKQALRSVMHRVFDGNLEAPRDED